MRIEDKDLKKHNWHTLEDCRYCSDANRRVKHMSVGIYIGKDGIYAETEDLVR